MKLVRCAGALEVPTTGVRHMREHARATLLTLTPTLPSRPDPCGPTCRPDCLSWGCPKIAPPSLRIEESASRVARCRASLRRRTASPSRVPSPWFRTTSTVSSSPTTQVCFALLSILGFALFHPVTKRESSRRGSCPSKLSLRRQRRIRSCCFQRLRLRGPASRARPSLAVPFTARLAPSPFTPCTVKTISHPTSAAVARCGCPEPGPRGLAPSSGPLLACPLPVTKARCSLGLGRFHRSLRRPLRPRRTSRRRSAG